MSYSTENVFPEGVTCRKVVDFAKILGYTQLTVSRYDDKNVYSLLYFDHENYKSWVINELSVFMDENRVRASTRTRIGRSHHDLNFQIKTARTLKKFLGGSLVIDGPEWFTPGPAFPPAASGCHLAICRLEWHISHIRAFKSRMQDAAELNFQMEVEKLIPSLQAQNPGVFLSNLINVYIVSAIEIFFKDTYIALLRYSERKSTVLKGARLSGDQMAAISDKRITIEEDVAENLPFQRMPAITRHFQEIDPKIDISGPLKKPYKKRKQTLYDAINNITERRQILIHKMQMDLEFCLNSVYRLADDVRVSMNRVHKEISNHYKWPYEHDTWNHGDR
jgi:hypothetical protein